MSHRPLDRINEAYKGELGEAFKGKTLKRINWIVNQVRGMKILDIGCSQGIISIILGREGKRVDAIDIAPESIEYAQDDLKQEHSSVQENVRFRVANFMTDTELDDEYDTVLLTEVLEHISDTDSFLNRIKQILSPNGILVVTVPFGINDYFDHKRTYYFTEIYESFSSKFSVEKIEYISNWIGIVCRNSEDTHGIDLWYELKKLESAFYEVENEYLTKVKNLQKLSSEKDAKIKMLQMEVKQGLVVDTEIKSQISNMHHKLDRNENLVDQLYQQLNELTVVTKKLTTELLEEKEKNEKIINELDNKLISEKEKSAQLEEENKTLKMQLENLKEQLYYSLSNEEKALKGNLKDKDQINQVSKQLRYYEQRYMKLKNSFLGSLTIKYWSLRKKLKIHGIKGIIKKLLKR
jgi:2-polyprenyl-3-methyl-5-hydroxy-6-metoxy-1,4-benzoquinol methylase